MMANEKRLIDANEIEELFYKQVEWGATDLMDAFDDALQDAQTVDAVEVVHGYWEKEHDDLGIDRGWKCSHCNGSVYEMTYESYQYCPHCGAKMEGGNEDG